MEHLEPSPTQQKRSNDLCAWSCPSTCNTKTRLPADLSITTPLDRAIARRPQKTGFGSAYYSSLSSHYLDPAALPTHCVKQPGTGPPSLLSIMGLAHLHLWALLPSRDALSPQPACCRVTVWGPNHIVLPDIVLPGGYPAMTRSLVLRSID